VSAETTLSQDLSEWVPSAAVITDAVAVVAFIDADGNAAFRVLCDSDAPVSTTIGLMELAKAHLLRFAQAEED